MVHVVFVECMASLFILQSFSCSSGGIEKNVLRDRVRSARKEQFILICPFAMIVANADPRARSGGVPAPVPRHDLCKLDRS